jgi:hypothetical protein
MFQLQVLPSSVDMMSSQPGVPELLIASASNACSSLGLRMGSPLSSSILTK